MERNNLFNDIDLAQLQQQATAREDMNNEEICLDVNQAESEGESLDLETPEKNINQTELLCQKATNPFDDM